MIPAVHLLNRVPDLVLPKVGHRMAAAFGVQLERDFCPGWDLRSLGVSVIEDVEQALPCALVVSLERTSDEPGAAAYHFEDASGRLLAPVFVGDILKYGSILDGPDSVSAAASHEILETLLDPFCTRWEQGPPIPQGDLYAFEGCDPVQGHAYPIDGVSVSNFIMPRWFSLHAAGNGLLDFLGVAPAPFQLAPGGYMVVRGKGGESQIFAAQAPSDRALAKLRAGKSRAGLRSMP